MQHLLSVVAETRRQAGWPALPSHSVPDPCSSLGHLKAGYKAPNVYAERAFHRKSTIFASTRRLIEEQGLTKLTIRDIAERSCSSVQTLYNLIGDRERIIIGAINEHLGALWHLADNADGYPNVILALTDAYYATCVLRRDYTLNALSSSSPTRIFHREIEDSLVRIQSGYLSDLIAREGGDANVDVEALARRITLFTTATVLDWNGRGISHRELRTELQLGITSLMLPWLPARIGEDLRNWAIARPH